MLRADTGDPKWLVPFTAVLFLDFAGHTLPSRAEAAPTQARLSDLSCFPSCVWNEHLSSAVEDQRVQRTLDLAAEL